MKLCSITAPAPFVRGCAGAFVLGLTLLACENAPFIGAKQDRTLELNADTIDVPKGTSLVDVVVRTDPQSRDFEPDEVRAAPGDYLRFTADDSRTHAIVFDGVAPEIRTFLENSGQFRSPPLVTKGASWVLALKDAPAGTYPFRCLMHNSTGQLVVGAR